MSSQVPIGNIIKAILWAVGCLFVLMFQILPTAIPMLGDWHGVGGFHPIENLTYSILGATMCMIGWLKFGAWYSPLFPIFAIIYSINF